MTKTNKQIHTEFCDYEIRKASKPKRILSVKPPKQTGIRTTGLSQATLAMQLASLF